MSGRPSSPDGRVTHPSPDLHPLPVPAPPAVGIVPGGTWTTVAGTQVGVAQGDIKGNKKLRDDVAVLVAPGVAAALTTTSSAAAAPCRWTRARVPGPVHAVVVNAGNANAATGAQGHLDTAATAAAAAAVLGCPADQVLVCSTGVIGVPMPMDRLLPAVKHAASHLSADGHHLARAILTTDLVEKEVCVELDGVTVAGVAKGSGMIHPGMATMLAFLVTDAQVEAPVLQALLADAVDRSFHCITVDGDASTNDTVIVQATGQGRPCPEGSEAHAALAQALFAACRHLARAIARDGEGATTLVECVLHGTADDATARAAARAVLRSPLVKSAVHGRDPNWGRVVGALGAAGVQGLDHLDLDLCGIPVLRDGQPVAWDEAAASAALQAPEVRFTARVPGPGLGVAWGCDLSADYVSINADYRS